MLRASTGHRGYYDKSAQQVSHNRSLAGLEKGLLEHKSKHVNKAEEVRRSVSSCCERYITSSAIQINNIRVRERVKPMHAEKKIWLLASEEPSDKVCSIVSKAYPAPVKALTDCCANEPYRGQPSNTVEDVSRFPQRCRQAYLYRRIAM